MRSTINSRVTNKFKPITEIQINSLIVKSITLHRRFMDQFKALIEDKWIIFYGSLF